MTDTPKHKNVHQALAAAQAEMQPPEKNATNPAFKRDGKPLKYADLTSVVESVRGPLTKHGIDWGWRSVEFMGGLAMEAVLTHGETETEITCAVPMYVDRNNMHGLKSAYTYAKRIGLESVTGQAPADDDDGNVASEAPPPRQEQRRDNTPAPAAKPATKDPVAIADALIAQIGKMVTLEQADAYPGESGKAFDAWEWLELEAPEQSKRVKDALTAKRNQLEEAPF